MNEILMKPAESPRPAVSISEAAASSGAKLRNAAIIALVLIIAGAIAGFWPRWRQRAELRIETQELAVQSVSVILPQPGEAAIGLLLPAEVRPFLDSPIYARSSGYVTNWFFDIGAQVKAGDLLAQLDAPELRQELVQAKAQLVQAEAALGLAKITADRWAELLKTASVSEQEAAEKKSDFELKTANVDAARANVRRLQELESFSHVKAPFSGTITARGLDIGQLIMAGSTKELFHLAQTDTLRVYVRVPQTVARAVVPGQLAELTIPEIPGKVFPAKVVRTSGAMTTDSRTLLTELEVDNSQHEILAGSYAQVRFADSHAEAALTVPSNTLLFRSEGPQVGVVRADGKVELRTVTLGRDFGSRLEILEGLARNDHVILNPADSLVSGITVKESGGSQAPTAEK
jgi:RND family efflux transporter MFP subunit